MSTSKMKIGSHFTLDGERWQVLNISALYVSAINSVGKRQRFRADQLSETLRLKLINANPRLKPADKVKPINGTETERVVIRCMIACGVSREHIERLASGNALPIRTVAMELLTQHRGG